MIISVLQWNVWYEEDIENIAEFLKAHKADVICLQELTIYTNQKHPNRPDFITEELSYNHYYKDLKIEGTDGSEWRLANGIFSRFPIVARHWTWINEPKAGGGYDDEYRAYVEVQLEAEDQKLSVGTTHMSYTDRFEETENKKKETSRLLDEFKKHQNNFVFTGDLNVAPNSDTITKISQLLQPAGPYYNQKTWTTKPFSYRGFEEKDLNWRLDYVFTTKDLKVISSEILQTNFSDHLPILAKIEI